MQPEPFTLLMTVYGGDREEYVRDAFRSAVDDQTLRPDQVVLVQDGPVPPEIAVALKEIVATSPVEVTFVHLEVNRGLGPALDAGLQAARYDIVARMDADDIAMPHRFELQVPLVRAGAELVGAGLLEFGRDTADVVGRRIPPSDPGDIVRYSRLHDPFNHPTVVYRRSAVIAAGGYGDLPLMEDYWLFVRMIAAGARLVNVAEPLVYYRVGDGAYDRRGGRALLRSELRLQREMLAEGFISRRQYVRNVIVRGGYRLVPTPIRRPFYRMLVAPYGARRNAAKAAEAAEAAAANAAARLPTLVVPDPAVPVRDPLVSAADPTMTIPDRPAYRPRHARPDDDVQTGYDIWPAYGAQDPTTADPREG
ncbi:glycosyltransferase [Actinomadura opuntiae]|uniref:glycosyltransferase n=1 Tax=Actinomadura sp. OS1-43 TaxID=604315 RepID=UPI00255AA800|nr:glycosyltransferase [Actinomadura sp. OS1-43]MDL4814876.1 glycosyltransferase [Actinomadura sp. OS1-43]